jgi:RNA polymerase sigma factor for flagellar operon FliA
MEVAQAVRISPELQEAADAFKAHGAAQAAVLLRVTMATVYNRLKKYRQLMGDQVDITYVPRKLGRRRQVTAEQQAAATPTPATKKPAKPVGNVPHTITGAVFNPELYDWWLRYKMSQHADLQARDALVQHYIKLVGHMVDHWTGKLPDAVDPGDLWSAAAGGLLESMETFDLSRGLAFPTYATQRMRGAILDYLRHQDHLPRLARTKLKLIVKRRAEMRLELGREPTDDELVASLPFLAAPADCRLLSEQGITSLQRPVFEETESHRVWCIEDVLVSKRNGDSSHRHRCEQVTKALLRGLPPEDFVLMYLYYIKGQTMGAIGEVLELSGSRVSQIHRRAIEQLRECRSLEDVEGLL